MRKKIKLWWWRGELDKENFGDYLSYYIVKKLTNREPVWTDISNLKSYDFSKVYVITGSVLGFVNKRCNVWGAGLLHATENVKKATFYAVRGPLTRKRLIKLGYKVPDIYGDPALLLPNIYSPRIKKKYPLGVIPHYVDYEKITEHFSLKDIFVVNLLNNDVEQIIDQIFACEYTISSSLHGLVTSHAYNIPCLLVKFSDGIAGDGTKFRDYFLSVGIEPYEPKFIDPQKVTKERLIRMIRENLDICIMHENLEELSRKLIQNCPFKISIKI